MDAEINACARKFWVQRYAGLARVLGRRWRRSLRRRLVPRFVLGLACRGHAG